MTKLEYQTITFLLKEREKYQEVLRGFKEGALQYVVSKRCDGEEITNYLLSSDEEDMFIRYFEKALKNIENELKELGYND